MPQNALQGCSHGQRVRSVGTTDPVGTVPLGDKIDAIHGCMLSVKLQAAVY